MCVCVCVCVFGEFFFFSFFFSLYNFNCRFFPTSVARLFIPFSPFFSHFLHAYFLDIHKPFSLTINLLIVFLWWGGFLKYFLQEPGTIPPLPVQTTKIHRCELKCCNKTRNEKDRGRESEIETQRQRQREKERERERERERVTSYNLFILSQNENTSNLLLPHLDVTDGRALYASNLL